MPVGDPETPRSRQIAPSLIVAACTIAVSLFALPRTIQAGDAGEFTTIMLAGGVPHPPGYPWMRILGGLARPLVSLGLPPASAAALGPALAGVIAWVVIHRVCVALGHAWTGAWAVLLVACSPLVLGHVPDAEVWGLHLALCATFVWLAQRPVEAAHARRRAAGLGLVLGLAFTHHQTAVLLVPLAVAATFPSWLWRGAATPWTRLAIEHARLGAFGLAGVALGLVPLSTLAIGSEGAWRWGDTQSAAGLLHHVLRADYGTLQLSLHDTPVSSLDTIARMLTSVAEVMSAGLFAQAWLGGLILLGLVGAALLERSRFATGLALSLVASSMLFAAAQNIDPSLPTGAWILERFDLLPLLLGIPALVLALDRLARALAALASGSEEPRWFRLVRGGAMAIALALLAAQVGSLATAARPATERAVELAALDVVRTPDPHAPPIQDTPIRAIVFGTDDHRSFPILYVQSVLGEGSHVLYIDASLFTRPWYRAWLRRRFAEMPEVDMPLKLIGALWSDPRFDGVPIYLANVFSRPANELAKVPEGLLWRVVPPADHPRFDPEAWTAGAVVDRHLAACGRMAMRAADLPDLEASDQPWASDLRWAYVEKAHALVGALARSDQAGRIPEVVAALALRTGVEFGRE